MTKFIGFSGPPGCGKDTLALQLAETLRQRGALVRIATLSLPLRKAVFALLGRAYSDDLYETTKDDPQDAFGGETVRRMMIEVSERAVKPLAGEGFYARRAIEDLRRHDRLDYVICTDVGFSEERAVFLREFGIGRCYSVMVSRKGCSFAGDSRTYQQMPRGVWVTNDSTIEQAVSQILSGVLG